MEKIQYTKILQILLDVILRRTLGLERIFLTEKRLLTINLNNKRGEIDVTHKRITESDGSYSEIFFMDDKGNECDESVAKRCVIVEYDSSGNMINEINGICNYLNDPLKMVKVLD